MQNNVETQHKHMYSLYIGSLPYGTLYLHRDYTGVRENLNAVSSAFYRDRENIYEQSSALMNSVQLKKMSLIQFDMQRKDVVYLLPTATVEAKLVFGEYSEHDQKLVDAREDYM